MTVSDADFLALQTSVNNLAVELGADPSAGYANLRNRLDVLATQLNNYQNQRLITMGGDLEGVSNDTHVVKLNGHAVSSVTPLDNYVMTWNDVSSQWEPKISASFTAAGDLFGNASTQTVIGLQGRAVASTAPTNGQALVWNSGLSSWAPATISGGGGSFTAGNDLAGTDSSQTVVGLRSRPLLATAPTSGQAIVWNGSAWAPADLPLAASGVTGIVRLTGNLGGTATSPTVTNFTISGATTGSTLYYNGSAWVQLTPGTIGQILTANGAAAPSWNNVGGGFTAGGDLTGSSSSQTVEKINGATVPVSGSLTTGNVLQVSGSAALSYAALNLAGGANYVTGILPAANHPDATTGAKGIVQLAGDIAGSSTSVTVAKINGATVPSAGSLTTGNVLQVSGTSAVSYSALNLAGGANYVTGVLPSANMTNATGSVIGTVQLAGDLGGSASTPTVVDLTIASEATGSMIYFNGTNWVNRAAGTANYILTANGAAAPTWNNSITAMTDVRSTNYAMEIVGGNNGKSEIFSDYFTTSLSQVTVRTISLATSRAYLITVNLIGVDNNTVYGGNYRTLHLVKSGKYYRESSGDAILSGMSTVQDLTPDWGESPAPAIDLALDINGSDVEIKVTGDSTFSAKWFMETSVRQVII